MPVLVLIIILLSGVSAEADIYKYVDEEGVILFTDSPGDGAIKLNKEGKPSTASARREVPSKLSVPYKLSGREYEEIIKDKCRKYSMDYDLIKALIKAESNFNPFAVSRKGARGLMQLMPGTAYSLGVYDPFDVEANIDGGVRYLKAMLERFGGDHKLALAAYNAGPNTVEKYGSIPPYRETQDYVKKIMAISGRDYNESASRASSPSAPAKARPAAAKTSETKKAVKKPAVVYKMVLDDGTVLYTNSLPQRF